MMDAFGIGLCGFIIILLLFGYLLHGREMEAFDLSPTSTYSQIPSVLSTTGVCNHKSADVDLAKSACLLD